MRRFAILAVTALGALGLTGSAHAADVSWSLPTEDTPEISTLAAAKTLHHVWLDETQCQGNGTIMMRARTNTGWAPAHRLLKSCGSKMTRLGRPTLVQDSGTRAEFVVYSVVDLDKPKRSGVYYMRVQGAGSKVGTARQLVSTPEAIQPVPATAAARSTRLWLMWQNPKEAGERTPKFMVQAFRQSTGRKSSRNIAVGSGTFRADSANGAMKLYAARLGLVAVWTLTDVAGASRTYIADTERYATSVKDRRRTGLNYRGEVGRSATTQVVVGEDRRLYRLRESHTEDGNLVTFGVDMWSFIQDKFRPAAGGKDIAMAAGDALLERQALAFQVDAQRNMYLAFLNFGAYENAGGARCITSDDAASRCVRAVAPNPAPPALYVNKITLSGAISQARVPWTFTPLAAPGADTIEWIHPPTWGADGAPGLEAITTQFGGVRVLMGTGHQDIANSGAVETGNYDYNVVLTDPLQFTHTPSFNPDDYAPPRRY